MWGTLNSRLDATWQDRLLGIEGIEKSELETDVGGNGQDNDVITPNT